MPVRRSILEKVEVTPDKVTDATTDTAATYVEVPIDKLLNRQHAGWTEEPLTDNGVNNEEGTSGVMGSAALMVAYDPADTFLDTFKTADQNRTRVWVKYTYSGSTPFVAGGETGCQVKMATSAAGSQPNELASTMIGLQKAAGLSGDSFVELTA